MTLHFAPDTTAPPAPPDVWDAQRLARLIADVGEAGLRDILRLFMADLPPLQQQFAIAAAAGDAVAARAVLAILHDSAAALGLAALTRLLRHLAQDPLAPDGPDLLRQETARIRFVPSLKHAS